MDVQSQVFLDAGLLPPVFVAILANLVVINVIVLFIYVLFGIGSCVLPLGVLVRSECLVLALLNVIGYFVYLYWNVEQAVVLVSDVIWMRLSEIFQDSLFTVQDQFSLNLLEIGRAILDIGVQ